MKVNQLITLKIIIAPQKNQNIQILPSLLKRILINAKKKNKQERIREIREQINDNKVKTNSQELPINNKERHINLMKDF